MLHISERPDRSTLRLGAVLAGGRSRRFGSPKQLAEVGGSRLVERVAEALRQAGARPVLITGPDVPDLRHILPCREDQRPGLGPLGGLQTALRWAGELGLPGMLCVACDLPFASAALLRRLAEIGENEPGFVVAPESGGPRGVEPLCAWYPASAAAQVERHLDAGIRSVSRLLGALPLRSLPIAEVERFGDPDAIFLNVNTPADSERASAIEARGKGRNGSA